MLGKAVLTLVVIIVAILVVKQRNDQETGTKKSANSKKDQVDNTVASDFRFAAYMFLVLMFLAPVPSFTTSAGRMITLC